MEGQSVFVKTFVVDFHKEFNGFQLRHLGGKFYSEKFLDRVDEMIYKQFDEIATGGDFPYIDKKEFLTLISLLDLEVTSKRLFMKR